MRLAFVFALIFLPFAAFAQSGSGTGDAAQNRRPSHCISLVRDVPGVHVIPASYGPQVPQYTVRLRYIDHAMFLLQTPGGLTVVTDYSGHIGTADFAPDVVTMNHAHGTHWTANPDPRVPHVLTGWNPEGTGPIDHHLDLGEMLVRNVTTDIRSAYGGTELDGNSIFVFEVEGLCIGHLGHLHHEPSPEQYAALGRLDVVMAPVDGGMTVPVPTMIRILQRLRSSVVIPMHWFSFGGLQVFLDGMKDDFRIRIEDSSEIEVSLRSLPSDPTVVVLLPRYLGSE